ncbi:MAG: M56 family metallopeptidase [Firmicutes bacterium]|nr:M56 family metallopeptidase [Bacillota bacterium]
MTKTASRNTKISLISLGALGIFALLAVAYNMDKWFAGGIAVKKITQACDIVGSGCTGAISSIFDVVGNPQQLFLSAALATLAFALLKAAAVIISARRAAAGFKNSDFVSPRVQAALKDLGFEDIRVRIANNPNPIAFTYGVLKPTICLSSGLIDSLGDAELSSLIAHEVGHVKRRDNLAILLAIFIRDFLWLLPISHYLFRVFVYEKEYAADDFAVKVTGKPVELASAIVSVAKAAHSRRYLLPAYATFFSDKATAKHRVQRLLEFGDQVRPSFYKLAVSALLSLVIVAGMLGIAYAQPSGEAGSYSQCRMDSACVEQNYSCCNLK